MPREARIASLLFGMALLVYLSTTGGSLTTTDAVLTYQVTKQMVEARSVAVPFGETDGLGEAHRGRDGRYYAPFGLGQSIYNLPDPVLSRRRLACER